VLPARDAASA